MGYNVGQPFPLAGTQANIGPGGAFRPNGSPAVDIVGRISLGLAAQLPPQFASAPDVIMVNGVPTVAGAPLAVLAGKAQDQAYNAPGSNSSASLQSPGASLTPIYDGSTYGNASIILVTFLAPGALKVLERPANTRISLLIVNDTVVGAIRYNWDKPADPVGSVPIAAGGNRNFAAPGVPQGTLWIFSPGAGNVIIEFMNKDIRQ